MTKNEIKRAVRASRRKDESRAQHAARVGIPYVTLRRMEVDGYTHRNTTLQHAYLQKLLDGTDQATVKGGAK